jgi:hypothetical protein
VELKQVSIEVERRVDFDDRFALYENVCDLENCKKKTRNDMNNPKFVWLKISATGNNSRSGKCMKSRTAYEPMYRGLNGPMGI